MPAFPRWRYKPQQSSFNTPVSIPTVDPDEGELIQVCFSIDWLPYVLGSLAQLQQRDTWIGTDDEKNDAIGLATNLIQQFDIPVCEVEKIGTPFWDDAEDVDDEAPRDDQIWYGEVSDPTAPPGELDFIENAAVWVVSGMIAYATGSIGVALAFRTFVSKFILIQRAGDVGETIRFVIDNQDAVTIDTTGRAGELIEIPIVGDESLDEHQLYIIKTG